MLYFTTFLSIFQHTNIRTPQWLGYIVQRPESHSCTTSAACMRGTTPTCRSSTSCSARSTTRQDSREQQGFYDGASARVGDMLLCATSRRLRPTLHRS